jgi:RNA polymerase sigma-70 factor (ECF subfamily)
MPLSQRPPSAGSFGVEIGLEPAAMVQGDDALTAEARFHDRVAGLFAAHFHRLYRVLDRLSEDPDLAADLAQETFVRLYRRGSLPDRPDAWLISVAMNLFRNAAASRSRRRRLLTLARGEAVHSEPEPAPDSASGSDELRMAVRNALDRVAERDRRLLLLRAEGYSYRDIAAALELNEASVGTMLSRAVQAFRAVWEKGFDGS